MPRNDLETL